MHQLICFTWPMNLYCSQGFSTKGENETEFLKGFEIFPVKPTWFKFPVWLLCTNMGENAFWNKKRT